MDSERFWPITDPSRAADPKYRRTRTALVTRILRLGRFAFNSLLGSAISMRCQVFRALHTRAAARMIEIARIVKAVVFRAIASKRANTPTEAKKHDAST